MNGVPTSFWTPERIEEVRRLAGLCKTDKFIAGQLGTTWNSVAYVRRKNGIPGGYSPQDPKSPPADFAKIGPTLTLAGCARHWATATQTARSWFRITGMEPAKRTYTNKVTLAKAAKPISFFKPSHTPMAPLPQRDGSEAGRAQLFLQRYGPVFRASTINPNATGWVLFGRRVSEADLIATAYRKGFRAEAMAA